MRTRRELPHAVPLERPSAHAERLQSVTHALADAVTPAAVYAVVLREGLAATGAVAGTIGLIADDGENIEIVADHGHGDRVFLEWRRFPIAAQLPLSEAVRTGEAVFVGSVAERSERYPPLEGRTTGAALAVVPLRSKGITIGGLALGFADDRSFAADERALLETLAQACAQALDRSRLYELAEQARAKAEADQERQRFLVEATETLSSSLDYQVTLRRLAQLVVPRLADWCTIHVVEADGALTSVALAHSDPERIEAALDLRRRYPADPDAPRGAPNVVRTGQTEVYDEIADELLVETARDEEHLGLMRDAGLTAAIVVPLTARSRTVGALTLASAESRRRFGPEDVSLAEEVARRAALAVENARLFEAEQRSRRQVQQLQRLTAALSEATTTRRVGQVIAEQAVGAVGAAAGAVLLVENTRDTLRIAASTGYSPSGLRRYRQLPLDAPLPVAACVRDVEPVWLESRDEAIRRFPALAAVGHSVGESFAALPLRAGKRVRGAIALSFADGRAFGADERGFLLTLADQCAQALERARLYDEERAARARAESAGRRLARLQGILEVGLAHVPLDELLDDLLARVRELISTDTATILLLDETTAELSVRASVGLDPVTTDDVHVPLGQGIAGRIAATGKPLVVEDVRAARPVSAYLSRVAASLLGVPLLTEEGAIGVLYLTTRERRVFTDEEVGLLETVAARAAVAIARTRLYEREHRVAETLQRSMLPQQLPELSGLELVARYVPASSGLSVGGDWYDAFELPGGRLGIVVGDIVGKGLQAATEMMQLRNAFRVYALEGLDPAEVFDRLNRLVERQGEGRFSTLVYAVYDPRSRTLRYVCAGHPPPLLRRPDGTTAFLEDGRALPLGVAPEVRSAYGETTLETGSTLLFYTDGLVERRRAAIGEGLARLEKAVAASGADLELFVDGLLEELVGDGTEDDVGLVALRLASSPSHLSLRLPAEPSSLRHARRELRAWLGQVGVAPDEVDEITLACNEACANAIEHPLAPRTRMVRLEADIVDGRLTVVVRDSGRWRSTPADGDRGFGLRVMRELMDAVDVNRSSEGTEVRLSLDLARSSVAGA